MKTVNTNANEVLTLGNISEVNLKKEVSTLRETEINQGEILMNWNSNLVKEGKWYDVSNSKLPMEFQKVAKETLAVEFFKNCRNLRGVFHVFVMVVDLGARQPIGGHFSHPFVIPSEV